MLLLPLKQTAGVSGSVSKSTNDKNDTRHDKAKAGKVHASFIAFSWQFGSP
jgi:hypothetical protein